MPTTEELLSRLDQLSPQGQVAPTGNLLLDRLNQLAPPPEEPGLMEQVIGIAEPIATMGTGIIGEIAGGVTGAVTAAIPGTTPGAGAGVSKAVREAFTYNPRTEEGKKNLEAIAGSDVVQAIGKAMGSAEEALGEAGYDIGGPLGGAIGETIPTAILEALGLAAPAALAKGTQRLGAAAARRGERIAGEIEELRAPAVEEGLQQVTEGIQKGKPEEMAALVQPDEAFYTAVDEMGISVEPLASYASQNPQFRAVEQGLASIPASQLDAQGKAFISEVSQKADDLIVEYGGTLDKAALSDRFKAESLETIENLADETDKLYDTLKSMIDPDTRVDALNTVAFIKQKAYELGGRKELSPLLNKTLRQLETTEKAGLPTKIIDPATGKMVPGKGELKQPTHERLNQTRKEVGQALNKRSGPFKDQETGLLKALYRNLREDQDAVAKQMGAADVSKSANALVVQRKQIEDDLAKLLGKDLEGSLLPRVGQMLKRLSRGEVEKWDAMMATIPANIRQEVVVTSLNEIFKGGDVAGAALNPTQFTKFMNNLDRSPATKSRLYKELPKESIKALENLRTVARGISTALQDKIPTGRVAAFFDDNDGILRRLMGKGIVMATAVKAGPMAAAAASEFINQSSNGSKAAAAVLASPTFQAVIRTAVRDGVTEGAVITDKLRKAEKAFERSDAYRKWTRVLTEDDRVKLASMGTITYLLKDREE